MDVVLTKAADPPLAGQPVEVVERKGLGHPDTICDALAEEVSVALCRFYLERFGAILHHNVDKVLLVGGQSRVELGGGEVLAPIEIYLAGRATAEAKGVRVPIEELAIESCRAWLGANLRYLEVDRHVRLHCRIKPGSADLVDLFLRRAGANAWLANDTSCGTGYAPWTSVEAMVLKVEAGLRSPEALRAHPERGEDLKLMAVRRGSRVALTVADALVARELRDLGAYRAARESIRTDTLRIAGADAAALEVDVNCGDDLERGSLYLTVTGTSAEAGDDGEAGRGNRSSGLITPYRPMSMESIAGKNPVAHVGKIYNVVAGRIARALVERAPGVRSADCRLVSRIGAPVAEPQLLHVHAWLADGVAAPSVEHVARELAVEQLSRLDRLAEDFVARRVPIA